MKRACLSLVMFIGLVVAGCHNQTLAPSAYVQWVRNADNGLVAEQTFKDISLQLSYRPLPELVLAEHQGKPTPAELQEALTKRSGAHYLKLRFKAVHGGDLLDAGASDPDAYYSRQYYLTSLIADDLSLVVGNDTLPCALAHCERTYGTVPFNDLDLSFIDDGQSDDGDLKLIYNDRAFGVGKVEFIIRRKDIDHIPTLKLS